MHAVDRPGRHRLSIAYIIFFWLPHVGGLSGCWNTSMESNRQLADIYYSPRCYWKGLAAIKKLATAAKVTEQQTKDWLKKQAVWQIYLLAPRHIPRPKFDVAVPNEVYQADLLFLPPDRVKRKTFRYALTVVDVASRYKEAEPLTSKLRQRSPMALLGFTSGAPCGGQSSTSWSASTGHWLNASSGTSMLWRCDSPPVNGPRSGLSECPLLS